MAKGKEKAIEKYYVCKSCDKGFCLRYAENNEKPEDCTYNNTTESKWKQISDTEYHTLANKLRKF